MLAQAGWTYRDGALRNAKNEAFEIELLNNQPTSQRVITPFQISLQKLGIDLHVRTVDGSLYQQRMDNFEYEMTSVRLPGSTAPGGELFDFYGSKAAATPGSSNIWGIADPAVDALLEHVVRATTRPELNAALRSLDRVLSVDGYYLHPAVDYERCAWPGGLSARQASKCFPRPYPAVLPARYLGHVDLVGVAL